MVTGANGFIGKAIVEQIKKDFEELRLIQIQSNRNKKTEKTENNKTKQNSFEKDCNFYLDITDKNQVSELKNIGNVDAIVHSAGLAHQFEKVEANEFFKVNVLGTENILSLGAHLQIKHFILISSVSVYGDTKNDDASVKAINEETVCAPVDAYAESKLQGENITRKLCETAGINLTVLRPATVIGEEDKGNFLRLIKTIDKKRFFWIGRGTNYKSLIHREDVAGSVSLLLKEKKDGTEIFNVSAEALQMKEIVEIICETLEKGVSGISINEKILTPLFAFNSHLVKSKKIEKVERTIEKWTADDVYSNQKLKNKYGFEPKIKVKEAIIREIKWYLTQKNKIV